MPWLREISLVIGATSILVLVTVLQAQTPVDVTLLVAFSACACLPLLLRRVLPLTAAVASATVGLAGIAQSHRWEGLLITMALFCMGAVGSGGRPQCDFGLRHAIKSRGSQSKCVSRV